MPTEKVANAPQRRFRLSNANRNWQVHRRVFVKREFARPEHPYEVEMPTNFRRVDKPGQAEWIFEVAWKGETRKRAQRSPCGKQRQQGKPRAGLIIQFTSTGREPRDQSFRQALGFCQSLSELFIVHLPEQAHGLRSLQ